MDRDHKHLKVSDIMTSHVLTIGSEESVARVNDIFNEHDIHHLPVVDKEGRVLGMVSKTDFMRISFGLTTFSMAKKSEYNQALYESLLVEDIMTTMVACLDKTESLSVAAGLFLENRFHAIPICSKHKLVGIVTTTDLIRCAYA